IENTRQASTALELSGIHGRRGFQLLHEDSNKGKRARKNERKSSGVALSLAGASNARSENEQLVMQLQMPALVRPVRKPVHRSGCLEFDGVALARQRRMIKYQLA